MTEIHKPRVLTVRGTASTNKEFDCLMPTYVNLPPDMISLLLAVSPDVSLAWSLFTYQLLCPLPQHGRSSCKDVRVWVDPSRTGPSRRDAFNGQ